MIKLTEHMQSLLPFHKTVFGCRILATAQAYGLSEPFARFWMQDEDRAAICMLDDTVILDVGAHADYDELKEFIRMTGAQRLLCDAESAQKLGHPVVRRGKVMVYQGNSPSRLGDFERNPGIRELYALISECATETFEPPEFESFYMDLSHRIRHDAAAAVGMRFQGELVSCAICSAKNAGCGGAFRRMRSSRAPAQGLWPRRAFRHGVSDAREKSIHTACREGK